MNLLSEHQGSGMLVRVTDCGCGEPDCDTLFVFASSGNPHLWLCIGIVEAEQLDWNLRVLLENLEMEDGSRPIDEISAGVAVLGRRWGPLTMDRDHALAQFKEYAALPAWMARQPVGRLWQTRRVVLGGDLTRVPAALRAIAEAYDPGGAPVRREEIP